MPTYLKDGDRIVDFVAGVTPIGAAAFLNEIQDQLRDIAPALDAAVDTRIVSILHNGVHKNNAGAITTPWWDHANLRWDLGSSELQLAIPIPSGNTIVAMRLTLYHSGADSVGGACGIYSQSTTPVAGAMVARTFEEDFGDVFNAGGATTYYNHSEAALSHDIAGLEDWYFAITGLGTQTCYLTGADVYYRNTLYV
jgi:hypothetical protein